MWHHVLEMSIRIAFSAEDTLTRNQALKEIANSQAISGDISGAAKTAELIKDDEIRSFALVEIAAVQVTTGDATGAAETLRFATETAERIEELRLNDWLFRDIAITKCGRRHRQLPYCP